MNGFNLNYRDVLICMFNIDAYYICTLTYPMPKVVILEITSLIVYVDTIYFPLLGYHFVTKLFVQHCIKIIYPVHMPINWSGNVLPFCEFASVSTPNCAYICQRQRINNEVSII